MRHFFILSALLALVSFSHADPTSVSGSITATGQVLTLGVSNNNTWGVQISGTWSGSFVVEGTINSTSTSSTGWTAQTMQYDPGAVTVTSITANGVYYGAMPGKARIRLRASSLASGTATCTLIVADSVQGVPVTVLFSSGAVLSVSTVASALPYNAAQETGGNLASLAAKDFSTETTLSSLNAKATVINTGAVSVSSSALPAGASTSALQTTGNSSLSSLDGKTTVINTGAVSVSSSALPAGASTSALQTTGNTLLSSIDGKTPALGEATKANSVPVVLASNSAYQGVTIASGSVTLASGGAAQAVSVISGVGGVSITAAQLGAWFQGLSSPAAVPFVVSAVNNLVTVTAAANSGFNSVFIHCTYSAMVGTIVVEVSGEGSNWVRSPMYIVDFNGAVTYGTSWANSNNGYAIGLTGGAPYVRVRCTAFAGSATVFSVLPSYYAPPMTNAITGNVSITAGTATIGNVGITSTVSTLNQGGNVSISTGTLTTAGNVSLNAGTQIIGALVANQSVNVAQMNGVAVTMGNGTSGTGVQRVVIASDNTSNTNPFLVNQSQINGVAVSTGNGAAGTGVQRMTIASDNAYIGATITAWPAAYVGVSLVASGLAVPVSVTAFTPTVVVTVNSGVAGLSTTASLATGTNVAGAFGVTRTPSIYTHKTNSFSWTTGTARGYAYSVSAMANVASGTPAIICVSAARGGAGVRVDFGNLSYTSALLGDDFGGGLVASGAGEQCWGPMIDGYVYIGTSGTATTVGGIRGEGVK